MHDLRLGPPVDTGEYMGPLLNGNPLHAGSCSDGVHGCGHCNVAVRNLSDEQIQSLGIKIKDKCEWCKKEVHIRELTGTTDVDEGCTTVYQVCSKCRKKYNEALHRELINNPYW
jgi:hypothetical protein